MGELPSGGIGPHDLTRLPGSDVLVVANGGIATHPESGRVALNPTTMRANLAYLDTRDGMAEIVELGPDLRQNSIRHLALRSDGPVAAAMQWQGPAGAHPPLLFTHRRGREPHLMAAPEAEHRRMQNYAGSVAVSSDGAEIAITSPRGGLVQRFSATDGAFLGQSELADVCGLAPGASGGFFLTSGGGQLAMLVGRQLTVWRRANRNWDNHIIPLSRPV